MATGGTENTDVLSDETFDLLCTVCKRKGRNKEAEKYCLECNDYYCLVCVKVHEDVPSLFGHKIFDKGHFPSRSTMKLASSKQTPSKKLPAPPTERCDRHSHYYIDMYCQNHDNVGCATCMAADHRSCLDIFYIPEFFQSNASTVTPKEIHTKLQTAADSLSEHHDNLQRQKQHLLKGKAESLKNIRKFRKEIDDRLDELEKSSADEIESVYKAMITEIDKAKNLIQINQTTVRSAQSKLASSSSSVSQSFVNVKKGKHIASNAAKCTENRTTQIHELDIEFKGDNTLSVLSGEMSALGMITQRNAKKSDVSQKSTSLDVARKAKKSKETAKSNFLQSDALLQMKEKKKYCVKVQSDKTDCNIVSACTLEDGTVILSDKGNMKLKRLDSSTYTVKDCYDFSGYPWQVCLINKQEVAVTLTGRKKVQFISVGSRMTKARKIKTDFECWGLAYTDGSLYISDSYTSVYIYSISGSKLKQFSKGQPELFSNIRSLAVNKAGSKIYVSDFGKGLIVLNNNGQVIGKFRGPQLLWAYDSYLTGRGSLLVCGINSRNVLQFGADGELIGEVLKSDCASYQAVCCNQQMSKMIVGIAGKVDIEVYDLT